MNVSLTPDLERFVREKVESGMYNSASEVVREALRLLVSRDRRDESHPVGEKPAGDSAPAPGDESLAAASLRLRQALEMLQLSYALMEQNLRRDASATTEAEIEQRLADWQDSADWGEEVPGYLQRSPERLGRLRRAAD